MQAFILIYILTLNVFYQRVKRLRFFYYVMLLTIIITISHYLIVNYQDTPIYYVIAIGNAWVILLELITLIAGLIYRFGYLKTPTPDANTILTMPTLVLFPYISLWGKMKNEHIAYWENFARQSRKTQ